MHLAHPPCPSRAGMCMFDPWPFDCAGGLWLGRVMVVRGRLTVCVTVSGLIWTGNCVFFAVILQWL